LLQSTEKKVILVVVIALIIRVALPLLAMALTHDYMRFHQPDTAGYLALAEGMITDGSFAQNGHPELLRTPGYPAFLVLGIASGNIEAVIISFQILLSCLTVYLVFFICLEMSGSAHTAIIACCLLAIEPLSIIYNSFLLTETLFTALNTLFLYYLVKCVKTCEVRHIVIASLALSGSIYVRPASYFLPGIVIIASFVLIFLDQMPRKALLHFAVFCGLSVVTIGLWQIRNAYQTGYSGFSTVFSHNLYSVYAPAVVAKGENKPLESTELYYQNLVSDFQMSTGVKADLYKFMQKEGIKAILGHPRAFLNLYAKNVFETLFLPGVNSCFRMLGYLPQSAAGTIWGATTMPEITSLSFVEKVRMVPQLMPPLVIGANLVAVAMMACLYLMAARAVLSRGALGNKALIMLLIVGAYLFLTAAGLGQHRMRHALMPIVCILAAYGFSLIFRIQRR
jgi:hypothetical protein